jgi:hypothetical protein
MKAPLILGNNMYNINNATLSVVGNAEALAVNQDPWGIQAQRVQAQAPADMSLVSALGNNVVVARCDASRPTQRWTWTARKDDHTAGVLSTVDADGNRLCVKDVRASNPGDWSAVPCDDKTSSSSSDNDDSSGLVMRMSCQPGAEVDSCELLGTTGLPMGWVVKKGASGPWPHTQYVMHRPGSRWSLSQSRVQAGFAIIAADSASIFDDNLVGKVAVGGDFCLDVVPPGQLEVWSGLLSGGRFAVSLFNRSPSASSITVNFSNLPAASSSSFSIRDIWAAKDVGTFTGSYSQTVPSQATAYLVLTPA